MKGTTSRITTWLFNASVNGDLNQLFLNSKRNLSKFAHNTVLYGVCLTFDHSFETVVSMALNSVLSCSRLCSHNMTSGA